MSTIKPGDFNSLPIDPYFKEMLTEAYKIITELNLWDWLKNPNIPGENGFMFSQYPEVSQICEKMKIGHSGSSFGFTMRTMETIAKNGWNYYTNTCPCRLAIGIIGGWCGVAGGGVPACDH